MQLLSLVVQLLFFVDRGSANGQNINEESGATNTKNLIKKTIQIIILNILKI